MSDTKIKTRKTGSRENLSVEAAINMITGAK